jgi:hypothetical protein
VLALLGIGGPSLGALAWYIRKRLATRTNTKKNNTLEDIATTATASEHNNETQTSQTKNVTPAEMRTLEEIFSDERPTLPDHPQVSQKNQINSILEQQLRKKRSEMRAASLEQARGVLVSILSQLTNLPADILQNPPNYSAAVLKFKKHNPLFLVAQLHARAVAGLSSKEELIAVAKSISDIKELVSGQVQFPRDFRDLDIYRDNPHLLEELITCLYTLDNVLKNSE